MMRFGLHGTSSLSTTLQTLLSWLSVKPPPPAPPAAPQRDWVRSSLRAAASGTSQSSGLSQRNTPSPSGFMMKLHPSEVVTANNTEATSERRCMRVRFLGGYARRGYGGGRRSACRDLDLEGGPGRAGGGDPHAALVVLHQLLHVRQAEAGALRLAGEEGLNHLVDVSAGQPGAVVLDGDVDLAASPAQTHG